MTLVYRPAEQVPAAPASPRVNDVASLREGVVSMLRQVWPDVMAGRVGAIVGEDPAGRVPALITAAVVNRWNRDHGRGALPVLFMEGAEKGENEEAVGAAFAARAHLLREVDPRTRILVVSDRYGHGHSLASIGRRLSEAGFRWDVAVVNGKRCEARTPESDHARMAAAVRAWEREMAAAAEHEGEPRGSGGPVVAPAPPDLTQVTADDERAIWPNGTRLFTGWQFAGHLQSRATAISGLTTETFAAGRVVRDPRVRAHAIAVRRAVSASIPGYLEDLAWRSDWTRENVLPSGRVVMNKLHAAVRRDDYGVVFGDDTSGRFFALLIGRAINTYRRREQKAPLPLLFLEGITRSHDSGQIESFRRFRTVLEPIDRSKRALLVTDNVNSGKSAGSIAWRLHEAGFAVDIVSMSGYRYSVAAQIGDGTWPPGTRSFGGGFGVNLSPLIDNTFASGLRQRSGDDGDVKFSTTHPLVLRDKRRRPDVVRRRHDVRLAAERLGARIGDGDVVVKEIELLAASLPEVARHVKDAVHRDEIRAVIGEDGGGRIPALIIGKAINMYRAAAGRPRLPILFIAPGVAATRDDPERRLASLRGGRALLFSGPMHSGRTTGAVAWWLHRNGVGCDIVAPRRADHSIQKYIDAAVLPPGTTIADCCYDTTEKGLDLVNHKEVTGMRPLRGANVALAKVHFDGGDIRSEVVQARREIAAMVPTIVECL